MIQDDHLHKSIENVELVAKRDVDLLLQLHLVELSKRMQDILSIKKEWKLIGIELKNFLEMEPLAVCFTVHTTDEITH